MNLCWINTAAGFQRVPGGIIRPVAINLAALRREKHWRWLAYYIIIAIMPSARRSARRVSFSLFNSYPRASE